MSTARTPTRFELLEGIKCQEDSRESASAT